MNIYSGYSNESPQISHLLNDYTLNIYSTPWFLIIFKDHKWNLQLRYAILVIYSLFEQRCQVHDLLLIFLIIFF